jgi:hypothetical protein
MLLPVSEVWSLPMRGRSSPTVFLHIGTAKTGTTYLQRLLWHNSRALEECGLRYPGRLLGDQFRASLDLRQAPHEGEDPDRVRGAWKALARAASAAPDRAVISQETLARARVEHVQRAAKSLRKTDLHLVATVRDMGRQLPAVWQEQVKNRSTGRYERFMDAVAERPDTARHRLFWLGQDVLDVLGRWSAAVPPERIHVITVPQPGAPSGMLWARFASVLGIDPSVVQADVPMSNRSLGVAEAELLRRLNRTLGTCMDWSTYHREIKVDFAQRLAARKSPARLAVPLGRRGWVAELAEKTIAGLEGGGYDIIGDLEELRPVFDEHPVMPGDIPRRQLMDIAREEDVEDLVGRYTPEPIRLRDLLHP